MRLLALLTMIGALALTACGSETKTTEGGQEVVTVTVTTEEETTTAESAEDFENAPEASDDDFSEDELDEEDQSSSATSEVVVGQSAEDDGVAFKVTKLAKIKSLARTYDTPIRPRQGANLWEAVIQFKNNTDRGVDPFCGGGSSVLIDTEDRNFDPHEDSISIKGNDVGYCGESLQPGFRGSVRLAFMVPAGTEVSGIAVWNGDFNNEDDPFGETYVVFAR